MGTFLFDQIIFGPVASRRLGVSLGINLLPVKSKVCTFNCIYCECGFTPSESEKHHLPARQEVKDLLLQYLNKNSRKENRIDSITFAGNGEPTLHPEFAGIISDTIDLRNRYAPNVKISVLSNATKIEIDQVFRALETVDENILKLDSAKTETINLINCPKIAFNIDNTIYYMKRFKNLTIQTLFLKGEYKGKVVDNTTEDEIREWLKLLISIKPKKVMIYTFARDTALAGLQKVSEQELYRIAGLVEKAGISTQVTA